MLGSPTVPPGPNSERTTRTCSGYASAARAAYLEVRSAAKLNGVANGHYPAATAAFYNVGSPTCQPLLSRPGRSRKALALGQVGLLSWPLGAGRLAVYFSGLVAFSGLWALVAFGRRKPNTVTFGPSARTGSGRPGLKWWSEVRSVVGAHLFVIPDHFAHAHAPVRSFRPAQPLLSRPGRS